MTRRPNHRELKQGQGAYKKQAFSNPSPNPLQIIQVSEHSPLKLPIQDISQAIKDQP